MYPRTHLDFYMSAYLKSTIYILAILLNWLEFLSLISKRTFNLFKFAMSVQAANQSESAPFSSVSFTGGTTTSRSGTKWSQRVWGR